MSIARIDKDKNIVFEIGDLTPESDVLEILNRFTLITTYNEPSGNYALSSLMFTSWIFDSGKDFTIEHAQMLWKSFSNERKTRIIEMLNEGDIVIYDMCEIEYRSDKLQKANLDIYADFTEIVDRIKELCDEESYDEKSLFMMIFSLADPHIGEWTDSTPYSYEEMEEIWKFIPNKLSMLKRINSSEYKDYCFW